MVSEGTQTSISPENLSVYATHCGETGIENALWEYMLILNCHARRHGVDQQRLRGCGLPYVFFRASEGDLDFLLKVIKGGVTFVLTRIKGAWTL